MSRPGGGGGGAGVYIDWCITNQDGGNSIETHDIFNQGENRNLITTKSNTIRETIERII